MGIVINFLDKKRQYENTRGSKHCKPRKGLPGDPEGLSEAIESLDQIIDDDWFNNLMESHSDESLESIIAASFQLAVIEVSTNLSVVSIESSEDKNSLSFALLYERPGELYRFGRTYYRKGIKP